MEVYNQAKKDLGKLILFILVLMVVLNQLDFGVDNTDKDGFNRSNMQLLTDYGTGLQYLYKGGALIPRLDKNGNQIRIK